jgi:hypothetical protein
MKEGSFAVLNISLLGSKLSKPVSIHILTLDTGSAG